MLGTFESVDDPVEIAMEIRRLGPEDVGLFAAAVGTLLDERGGLAAVADETHLRQALENRDWYFLVGLVDGEPVGYLSAFCFVAVDRNDRLVYLYDIVVQPRHRRQGIASAMIEQLESLCRIDNVSLIWAGTSADNRAARSTFEAAGARNVGESYVEYLFEVDDSA